VSTPPSDSTLNTFPARVAWSALPPAQQPYVPVLPHPSLKSLILAVALFLLTLCTCLAAGTQFAAAYAHDQAVSVDEFLRAFTLFYKNPAGLLAGLPFAATLLTILLAHELGHFFACRYHHIRSTYPFFIPFPSLIGTFGAFILIRSPIRTTRALFDVGASGPLVGFVFAVPALVYGVLHSSFVPALAHPDPAHTDLIFGAPLLLRLLDSLFHPGINSGALLLPPIGRAAWVGLFATSLNLLPMGQLDGGHILRSLNPRAYKFLSWPLIAVLLVLGRLSNWWIWYIWAGFLLAIRLLRTPPVYDASPLDPARRFGAFCALIIFVLSFMPAPISGV
jgi:membrane-associated protease RseP (regulator of RpoE activity)